MEFLSAHDDEGQWVINSSVSIRALLNEPEYLRWIVNGSGSPIDCAQTHTNTYDDESNTLFIIMHSHRFSFTHLFDFLLIFE